MSDLGDLKIRVTGDIQDLVKKMDVAGGSVSKFSGTAAANVGKLNTSFGTLRNSLPGIANAMGNVASATGEAGSAFSGLGSLLAGGVLAGVTILTSELYKYFTSVSEAVKAQRALNEAMLKSTASVAGEVAGLQALITVARDETQTKRVRLAAIEDIKKAYPEYLKGLTLENSNTDLITRAINSQIDALKRRANVKAIEQLIDQQSLKTATIKLALEKVQAAGSSFVEPLLKKLQKDLEGSENATDNLINKLNELVNPKRGLATNAADLLIGDPVKEGKEIKVKEIKIKPVKVKVVKPEEPLLFESGFWGLGKSQLSDMQEEIDKITQAPIDPNGGFANLFKSLTPEFIEFLLNAEALNRKLTRSEEIVRALTPAFGTFFDTLLSGGGSAFQAFGQALTQLLKQLVATALKAIALGFILSLLPGGKVFKLGDILGKAFGIGGKATGGPASGLTMVGERGPELVMLPRHSQVIPNHQINGAMGGTQVFIPAIAIRGSDLLLTFNRASQQAGRNS